MTYRFSRRTQLFTLLLLIGLTALLAGPWRSDVAVPEATPTGAPTPGQSPTPGPTPQRKGLSSEELPPGAEPIVVAEDWGAGCHSSRSDELAWVVQGDRCISGELELPLSRIGDLRRQILASREKGDVLHEFDDDLDPEFVKKRMVELYPWVEAPLPEVSQGELTAKAYAILFDSELGGSTAERGAWLELKSKPAMKVRVYTSSLFAGRSFGGIMHGLVPMEVEVEGAKWATLSPDLARALIPFSPEGSYWQLYPGWVGQFLEHEAMMIGLKWANRYIQTEAHNWPGGSRLFHGYRLGEYSIATLTLYPRADWVFEEVLVPLDTERGLAKDWNPLAEQLGAVEDKLVSWRRLESAGSFRLTFPAHDSYRAERWAERKLNGDLGFVLEGTRGGCELLFGLDESRVLVHFPSDELAKILRLEKQGHRYPDVLVDEDGTVEPLKDL